MQHRKILIPFLYQIYLHLPICSLCLPNYPYLFKYSVVCLNSLLLKFYDLFCNFLGQIFVLKDTLFRNTKTALKTYGKQTHRPFGITD